jgi:hypothetical protein
MMSGSTRQTLMEDQQERQRHLLQQHNGCRDKAVVFELQVIKSFWNQCIPAVLMCFWLISCTFQPFCSNLELTLLLSRSA